MEAIAMYLEISRMVNGSLLKIIENEDVDISSIKMQFQVKRADSDQVEIKSPDITLADFIKVWKKTGEKVEEFLKKNAKAIQPNETGWTSVNDGFPYIHEREEGDNPSSDRAILAKPARSALNAKRIVSWTIYEGWFSIQDGISTSEIVFTTNHDEVLTPNYDDLWMILPPLADEEND